MRTLISLVAVSFTCAQLVPAQTGPQAEPVIRVNVDLVQVDAIVTDAKGHHITDLRPEDFEVLEDGRPQKITNFSFIRVKAAEVAPVPRAANAATDVKNPAPSRNPRKADIRRTIALMLDDAGTNSTELFPVLAAARRFVDEKIAPGDMISVTASHGGMGFYQQFTNDKRQMHAAIDQIPERRGWLICDFIPAIPDRMRGAGPSTVACPPADPIGYLTNTILRLRDVPGRKAVVLFTHRFNAPPYLVDLANRAGIVIYVIDPTGASRRVQRDDDPELMLAKDTGGLFVRSAPGAGLVEDLGEVLEDMSGYYLLAYRPDRPEPAVGVADVRHNISVKVLGAGLTVRARNGFFGVTDPAVKNSREVHAAVAKQDPLDQAMYSAFAEDGIRVRLNPLFAASAPNAKGKRTPALRALLEIDGRDVTFTSVEGGNRRMVLDVVVGVFHPDGTEAGKQNQVFTVNVPAEKVSKLSTVGLQYSVDVAISQPGPYQVRAAVKDEASGEVGSSYAFLSVPDFNLPQISLSSLVLSLPAGAPANAVNKPEWSEFVAGTAVQFGCEVFGVKTASEGWSKVEMEVKLFRGGVAVVDTPPAPVRMERSEGRTFLSGMVKIPEQLEAGDYALEVVAYDRLQVPKKQMAAQWVDVSVLNR